ncbi:MAG: hypothetical protein ACQESN_07415 [Thermotogota bacterium]
MNKKILIFIILIISLFSFTNEIKFDFINTDLKDALDEIASKAKIEIIYSENITGEINLSINTNNIETALELLLFGKPYFYKKYSERIYLVGDYRERNNIANYLLEPNIVKMGNISTNSISELLNLYSSRVKYLKDSNVVIVYGKDDVAMKIIKLIKDIDNNSFTNKILTVNVIELSEVQWRVKEASNIRTNYIVGKDIGINYEFLNFEENLRYNYYNIFKQESQLYLSLNGKNIAINVREKEGFNLKLSVEKSLMMDVDLNNSQINTPVYYFFENSNKYFMIILGVYEKRDYKDYFQEVQKNYLGLEYEFNINRNYIGLEFINKDYVLNFKYGFFDEYFLSFTDEIVKDFYSHVGLEYFTEELDLFLSFQENQFFEEFKMTGEIGLVSNVSFETNNLIPAFKELFYDMYLGYENDIMELGVGSEFILTTNEIIINPYIDSRFFYSINYFKLIGEFSYIIDKGFRINTKVLYNF